MTRVPKPLAADGGGVDYGDGDNNYSGDCMVIVAAMAATAMRRPVCGLERR